MINSFQDRNIVVTGGTGALGAAVVALLVAEGAHCFVPVHRKKDEPTPPGGGTIEYVEGVDLTEEPAVEKFYHLVSGKGPLWASIHAAGGFALGKITETKKTDFHNMMAMNTLTTFLCCREAVRPLRATNGGGRIVNVAAKAAVAPVGGMIPYIASKAAVVAITQSLAEEVAQENILVNAILPSIMDTPANRAAMPNADFSKWPKVEEIANTILMLISPANTVTRNALVPVYGRS